VLLVAVGVLAVGLSITAYATHLLRQPELGTVDTRFAIRGGQPAPKDIVLVSIDDNTFNDLGKVRFPFPRRLHAQVIDRLHADGAKVIGYDVQFTEQTDQADDNALIEAVARAPGMVLAATETDEHGHTRVLGGDEVLRQVGARAGNTLISPDADGVYRRFRHSVEGLTSFAVATAEQSTHRRIGRSAVGNGSVPVDFRGAPGTIRSVPFSRVLRGRFAPRTFRGKIVIVGATAPSLQDVHPTAAPHGQSMAGPEILANEVSTVLRGFPLRDSSTPVDVLLIVLLGLAVPAGSLRLRGFRPILLAAALGVAYAIAAQLAFDGGRIIPFIYPLLALALATLGTLAVNYVVESFERERVHDLFARFVPEPVVKAVVEHTDENLRLGGVERECTVMFCDLRGFTTFSESLPAERVIEVVNVYLGQMSEAILESGGTLLAYLGDGIMALFGAPLPQEDHADRALAAAREMMGPRLGRFNAWLREQGLGEGFRMGIGLNSGEVMAGNVGSERRIEYTAIGDTTNTASRLEGLTKGTPHMLFIADSTRAAMQRAPGELVYVGEFDVRGRKAKLKVWSVPEEVAGAADSSAGDVPHRVRS
jgi:adenylate cyclase